MKEYKNIKIQAETYKYLEKYKLDGRLTSYTDVMKKLLGQEVEATAMKKLRREDTVPKFVIESCIVDWLIRSPMAERKAIIHYVYLRLRQLGWCEARPEYMADKTWRSPFMVAVDNCIWRLQSIDIINAHESYSSFKKRNNGYYINYDLNIPKYKYRYLRSANDYLDTYGDESYTKRMTLEDVKPSDKIKLATIRSKQ
jgi:predicted CopG family antitoxin